MSLIKKGKNLIFSIISIVFSILAYISFAFDWYIAKGNDKTIHGKYLDFIKTFIKSEKNDFFNPTLFKLAYTFIIVLMICLAILLITIIINLFIKNSLVIKIGKNARFITKLVVFVGLLIFFAAGFICYPGEKLDKIGIIIPHVLVFPGFGIYWLVISSFIAQFFAKRVFKKSI